MAIPSNPITIISADYYDTNGSLVRNCLSDPKKLKPLGSWYFYVATKDTTGGWGANFIVKWKSDTLVNVPIIENLMAGSSGTQGFTFVSRGQVIKESPD